MKKPLTTLAVLLALVSPLTTLAAVSDNSTHATEQHIHEDVKTEYIDIVEPNGEYVVADGKIQVKIDETGKVVSVDNLKPNKIYSYISDNYVLNNKIKDIAVSLCGTYLDEVINPLSAIGRMFGYNIKFISNSRCNKSCNMFYTGCRIIF